MRRNHSLNSLGVLSIFLLGEYELFSRVSNVDDAKVLRPLAIEHLSQYGRVIFGMNDTDVGHTEQNWGQRSIEQFQKEHDERFAFEEKNGIPHEKRTSHQVLHYQPKSREHGQKQSQMAMAEWWVMAQSNWLMMNAGSSFSTTAASVGLSTTGVMERFDYHEMGNIFSTFRPDWEGDVCVTLGGATRKESATCPNSKK